MTSEERYRAICVRCARLKSPKCGMAKLVYGQQTLEEYDRDTKLIEELEREEEIEACRNEAPDDEFLYGGDEA